MSLLENNTPILPKPTPIERPDWTPVIVHALRAIAAGEADERQQKLALDYIVKNVCCTYDMAYRPGRDGDTDFALGKQHVGQTLVYLLNDAPTRVDPDKVSARKVGE